MSTKFIMAGAFALTTLVSTHAALVSPVSYDMPNGHGQASGGTFNYWDKNYSGSGATTTDYAPLSGGLGDLTDGVIPTDNWFNVENAAGDGPYVGWYIINPSPTIKFNFAGLTQIDSLTIYVDDSDGAGGVMVPASVDIKGDSGPSQNILLAEPPTSTPTSYTFSGLNLNTTSIKLTLNHKDGWVFMSEVTFDGQPAGVPDSTNTTALLAVALMGLAVFARKASAAPVNSF